MGASDLLAELAGAGLTVTAAAGKLLIRPAGRLSDRQRNDLASLKPELLALLASSDTPPAKAPGRPYALTKAQRDAAHAQPWDAAACSRFLARAAAIRRRGFGADDAEDLAELAHLLDLQAEGRVLCLVCTHLAGDRGTGWRCGNSAMAEVGRELAGDLVTTPQRCGGFGRAT